jgi:D-serine dehydratase
MRSADLILIPEPYWMSSANGTTHGTPFDYDTHVPVMFLGEWIKAGRYHRNIAVNDIAPTLATILDVETPSGSVGRVLDEMLQ